MIPDSLKKVNPCIKPEKINLTDCLACSGCITTDEVSNFAIDLKFLQDTETPSSFIISKFSKMNIYEHLVRKNEMSYSSFEKFLIQHLKNRFKTRYVVDSSYFSKSNDSVISSECPAVVLYIERVYPELIDFLSKEKTLQQKSADFINYKILQEDSKNPLKRNEKHRIITVQQCYDKKDEIKRDNCEIHHYLGTMDLLAFIGDHFLNNILIFKPDYYLEEWEKSHSDYSKEINGIENCINIFNKMKYQKEKSPNFLELRICKNGCASGPAQIIISDNNEHLKIDINDQSNFNFNSGKRIFNKAKKKTFAVDW